LIEGYLAAFEPDFIVATEEALKEKVAAPSWQIIGIDDILVGDPDREIQYGIPVTTYYRQLYREEFKFERKKPVPVFLPKAETKSWDAFAGCVFGLFPDHAPFSEYAAEFADLLGARSTSINEKTLLEIDRGLYPLLAGSFRLKSLPVGSRQDPTLFLMDPRQGIDLIDFWNLRALGWTIWPVPIQWAELLKEPCRDLVKEIHRPHKHNGNIMHDATVLKSRRVSADDLKDFYQAVRGVSPKDGRPAAGMQAWFPRLWESSGRYHGHVERASVFWEEEQEEVEVKERRMTFRILAPEFVKDYGSGEAPRWANVVALREYGGSGEYPTCFPEDIEDCHFLFRSMGLQKITSTREGLVLRCLHKREHEYWELPTAEAVLEAWLKQRGIRMAVSSAGNTCRQLMNMIGGPMAANLFNREEIVRLFDKMACGMVEDDTEPPERKRPKRRFVTEQELVATLKKCHSNNQRVVHNHLRALIRSRVLRVGLRVECSACGQANWYPLGDISEELRCERCLSPFDFPQSRPSSSCSWTYRVQGPFSTEDFARGSYSVALTLRLMLNELHFESSTWIAGAEMQDGTGLLEADIVAFLRRDPRFSATRPRLVFAECKSFNRFAPKDIERAENLIQRFPGAAFCFATMRNALEEREKRGIAKLARKGRQQLDTDTWRTPVIVLTGTELFSEWYLSKTWQDKGGRHATLSGSRPLDDEIQWLAEITQMLYLDMESYGSWVERKYAKKRSARSARKS